MQPTFSESEPLSSGCYFCVRLCYLFGLGSLRSALHFLGWGLARLWQYSAGGIRRPTRCEQHLHRRGLPGLLVVGAVAAGTRASRLVWESRGRTAGCWGHS